MIRQLANRYTIDLLRIEGVIDSEPRCLYQLAD